MYSNSNGDVNAPDTKVDVPKVLDILVSNQLLNGSKLTYLKQKKKKRVFLIELMINNEANQRNNT